MAKKLSEYNIYQTIDKILSSLEKNYSKNNKIRMSYENVYELINTLFDLFKIFFTLNPNKCSIECKKRYIPILNLLLNIDNNYEHKQNYLIYLKEAYRIAAARDFESFIIYYEWELPEKDKFYAPRMKVLGGFVYYLNKMIFDENFEGIIANLPSGWGKTYLIDLANAFSYGIDDKGTILALCSNEDVVNGGSRTVKEIMQTETFGEVFPHLKWSKDDKSYFKKDTESEWILRDCKLSASYYARTTKSNVVGCRASKWVWIDDLYADYKEALVEKDNKFYFNKFLTVWRKRFVQEAKIWKFIITGTMWSPTDFTVKIIDWLKDRYEFVKHPVFPFVQVSNDGKFAIIQVPALNVKTNKSNCEALASTKTLLNEKKSLDTYIFECNFQQNPVSPEALAFDWKNIKQYKEKLTNEYGSTISVIDGTRKSGKDFFSMPILQPYLGDYALVDCIFTQKATTKLFDEITNKIIENNIKILVIETNVDGGLKKVIQERLNQRGFNNGIQIIEKYSTVVKQTRIELERGNIIDRIYYPAQNLFPMNSDMGKFMSNFTMYNIEGGNVHDDACFEGDTLIATQFGYKKIKDIKIGDKVITPFGLRKVINCGITGYKPTINKLGLKATKNHKVYNKKLNEFTPLDTFTMYDESDILSLKGMIEWKKKLLNLTGKYTKETQRADIILSTQQKTKIEKNVSNYTEQYGNITKEKSLKGIKYTILMVILMITTFLTWNVFQLMNTYHIIVKRIGKTKKSWKNKQNLCEEIALFKKNARNGIEAKKEEHGIENMLKTLFSKTLLEKKEYANGVEKNTLQKLNGQNTVQPNVNKKQITTQKSKFVQYVEKNLDQQIIEQKHVQENVNENSLEKEVYNLTVENGGCYYANNILVSNCDSLAMVSSEIISGKSKPIKPVIIKRPF